MKKIYLIGFMGSGKSTVGERLSKKIKWSFVDTDHAIEKKYNRTIPQIFKEEGETTFRTYESELLRNLPQQIISTGGGIIEKKENINYMKQTGKIVFLHTSFAEINQRLKDDKTRPLWKQSVTEKKKLFKRRYEMYKACADQIIYTDGKTVDEVTEELRLYIE